MTAHRKTRLYDPDRREWYVVCSCRVTGCTR